MPSCRVCRDYIGAGKCYSPRQDTQGDLTWLCRECFYGHKEATDASAVSLVSEAFRLGSRQGWERCIESLRDYRGDGLVTDDMVAWLEKEMKEDCG